MTCSPVSFGSAQDIHWLRHCRRPARNINKDNCKESSAEPYCIGRPGRGSLETMREIFLFLPWWPPGSLGPGPLETTTLMFVLLTAVAARLARAGAVRIHGGDVSF